MKRMVDVIAAAALTQLRFKLFTAPGLQVVAHFLLRLKITCDTPVRWRDKARSGNETGVYVGVNEDFSLVLQRCIGKRSVLHTLKE
jgi:hypothetical protein